MKINVENMLRRSVMILTIAVMAMSFTFCKSKDDPKPNLDPAPVDPINPDPVNGKLPDAILPAELYDTVSDYFRIYEGENPPVMNGQYVSSPHRLLFASTNYNPDSIQYHSDRYVAFITEGSRLDFHGQQLNTVTNKYDNESHRGIKLVGDTTSFTCYYLFGTQINGLYAQQSTIFSGIITDEGLKDFQVAVILLETSGNPELQPKNSFRILGDEDGLAVDTTWLNKKSGDFDFTKISDEELFKMWKK